MAAGELADAGSMGCLRPGRGCIYEARWRIAPIAPYSSKSRATGRHGGIRGCRPVKRPNEVQSKNIGQKFSMRHLSNSVSRVLLVPMQSSPRIPKTLVPESFSCPHTPWVAHTRFEFEWRGVLMADNHRIFIKWGKLQIGAFGIPAVLTILLGIVALGRLWGAW